MKPKDVRRILKEASGYDEEIHLPAAILDDLAPKDLPEEVRLGVGEMKDSVTHVEWSGVLVRSGNSLLAKADLTWTRKYWYLPLNLEQYMDLVRRAIEKRERTRGDVKLLSHDDDGAYIHLAYEVSGLPGKTLGDAYKAARKVTEELEEYAEQVSTEVGRCAAEAASRIEGWGSMPLPTLKDGFLRN